MSCLALAPPRRPKEWKASWAYGHALPRAKTPTIFVPTQPVLSANAWEYNQISLSWSAPLVGAQPGDYYEVQISTDGGTTWQEHFRRLPYADIQTGAIQTGADFAGFDPGKTYHFRVRPFKRTVPQFTLGDWTDVASATTPNYVQSGQPTSTGGVVRVVNNRSQWVALDNVVQLGDIVELSLQATDLSTILAPVAIAGPGKWVTVRSQGYDTSGLKYDKRVTAADVSKMAIVWVDGTTNGNVQALGARSGAKYWTFEGIHVQCRKSSGDNVFTWANAAVDFGPSGVGSNQTTTLAAMKSHIELHRCYIDKTTDMTTSAEGVLMNSVVFGVLKDCVIIGGSLNTSPNVGEGRGLVAYTSENVIVDNCSIAGAAICFMLDRPCALTDGNRTNNRNWLLKRCWFNRRQAWKDAPSSIGMKNLVEFKRGTDCDYFACVGEFNRMGSNQFNSILYTPRGTDQLGTIFGNFRMDYCKFSDITRGFHFNIDTLTAPLARLATRDLVIENTLIDGVVGPNPTDPSIKETWFVEVGGPQNEDLITNIYLRHCTFIDRVTTDNLETSSDAIHFEASSNNPQIMADNFKLEYCMIYHSERGIHGAPFNARIGAALLDAFVLNKNYAVTGNVFGGGNMTYNVASNYTGLKFSDNSHESAATFQDNFESYATGDYRLKSSSIHKGAAPDGKDRGADIAMLNAKTLHVVDGNWTEVLPTDIDDLEEWFDAGYQMYKDAGVTIAADGDTVQQGVGRSSLALVASNATASQRPKLRAATLAVPSLEFNSAANQALLYPVNTLDLRTDDATWFYVFQYGAAVVGSAQYLLGNWTLGGKGYTVGVSLGKMRHTFVTNNTNYSGLDQADDVEVTWGDVVIACVRWDNSTGRIRISVQTSDSDVLIPDVDHTVPALAGLDIDAVAQLAVGRNADQTALASHRMMHFMFYRGRELSDFECQTVANYCANDTNRVPQYWTIDRDSLNPLTTVPPGNTRESYYPQPFRIGTSPYMICKGNSEVYLWKASNDTSQFFLQNSNLPVITRTLAGTDGANSVTQGTTTHDAVNNTLHSYTKGLDSSNVPRVIHFTASDTNPNSWSKAGVVLDPTPFLPDTVIDINCDSVLKVGSTWHYFGTRGMVGGNYRIWHGTSTGWNNTITIQRVYSWPHANNGNLIVHGATVFKNPSSAGGYFMSFSLGRLDGGDGERNLYMAYAPNLDVDEWQYVGTLLRHETTGWESTRVHHAAILRKNTDPFDLPEVINGKWHMYYSGSNLTGSISTWTDQAGRLIMTPLL